MSLSPAVVDPSDGFRAYVAHIRTFPMLDAEEERRLAEAWRDRGDPAAGQMLVTSHLRLVAKIAVRYRGYGLPLADLVSEGNVGLMQALRHFDPGRGFRFATYAMWWIRAAIQDHVLRSWSLVRTGTTLAQRKLFFSLRRLKAQIAGADGAGEELPPTAVREVAARLKVREIDVVEMSRRLAGRDMSLNVPVAPDAETELQDMLAADDDGDPEALFGTFEELAWRRARLDAAMASALTERERHILAERRLRDRPARLDALAACYGLSRERIRQIEEQAIRKLRAALDSPVAERQRKGGVLATA